MPALIVPERLTFLAGFPRFIPKPRLSMRRLLWLLCLLVLLLPAGAQDGYPPVDSELVFSGRMFDSSTAAVRFLRRLKALPWMRAGLTQTEKALGIKLEGDFLDWMDGRVVLAIVRTDDRSPLHHLFGETPESAERTIAFNLQTLYNGVAMYQLEKSKLPPDLESLVPEYIAALPEEPSGVTYRIEPGAEGAWSIQTTYQGAPGPSINSENELTPELDVAMGETPRLNLVLSFRVYDVERARLALSRLLPRLENFPGITVEQAGNSGWDVATPPLSVAARLSPHWLVFTDNSSLAEPSLQSLEGQAPSLTSNPRFQEALSHLPERFRNYFFVDVAGILGHWPGLKMDDPVLQQALESVQSVAGTTSYRSDQVVSEFFVCLAPPAEHPLGQLLSDPGPTELTLLRQAPWSTAYISVIDLGKSYDLVKRAASVNSDTERIFRELLGAAETSLGLSFEKDLLPNSTGEIAICYEQLDVLFAAIMREWRELTSLPEESEPETSVEEAEQPSPSPSPAPGWIPEGPPPPEAEEREEPAESPKEVDLDLASLPYTIIIGLRPGPARQDIMVRLRDKLGSKVRLEPHAGVDVFYTADDQVAYAIHGNYLMVSTGGSYRLMLATLDSMTGRVSPLSRLNSYQTFIEGTEGRVLAAGHQKVDDVYSLLKGMILLSGAEFRPEATALGRWRDAYSILTIEPGGIRLRFSVYATEQVP
ncbi:MAG: hypothetical protein AMXMBFR33_67580 [Candidatus Xenobia bacterium]